MKHKFLSGLIVAGALAFGSVTTASADGSIKDSPGPVPSNWSGYYVGVHAGHAWSDVKWDLAYPFGAPPPSSTFNNDGFILGGHLGVLMQRDRWVYGGEVSFASGFGSETKTGINLFGGAAVGDLKTEIDGLLTVTGRVGYTWDRTLGYVKGGYAGATVRLFTDDNVPPDFVSTSSKWHNGWTVGAGIEYMLTANTLFGVEYNYIDLGGSDSRLVTTVAGVPVGGSAVSRVDTTIHTLMARISVKFGH